MVAVRDETLQYRHVYWYIGFWYVTHELLVAVFNTEKTLENFEKQFRNFERIAVNIYTSLYL